jgi:hypothetical protein
MCVQAIPALLSAGGAVVQQVGQNQDRRDQARLADEALRRNTALNNKAGERVSQEIQNVTAANPEEERQTAQNDFMAALRKAKVDDGGADFGGVPGASDRFTADVGQARGAASAEGRALSGNLAAIDAPQYSRINEGRQFADTATDLSLLQGQGRGQDFLAQLRAARTPGSGLQDIGGGLTAFGEAYGQRARPPVPVKKPVMSGVVGPR